MSSKAAPLDLSERPVMGAPRVLPVVLLCHATVEWCGQTWICNTMDQFEADSKSRHQHEKTCEAMQELRGLSGTRGKLMTKLIV